MERNVIINVTFTSRPARKKLDCVTPYIQLHQIGPATAKSHGQAGRRSSTRLLSSGKSSAARNKKGNATVLTTKSRPAQMYVSQSGANGPPLKYVNRKLNVINAKKIARISREPGFWRSKTTATVANDIAIGTNLQGSGSRRRDKSVS